MEKQQQISVNFRIKKLELLDHSLRLSAIPANIVNQEAFYFATTVGINFDIDNRNLLVRVDSVFSFEEKQDIELGSISTLTTFLVEDLEKFVIKSDDKILVKLPDVLMANFIGLAISSSRGMLATLTKGTALEPAILPIQNPLIFAQRLGIKTE